MGEVFGYAFRAIDLGGPLGHVAVHPSVIDFLECLAIGHVGADLADEDDHGRGILHGGMNADGRIGCSRAPGHECEPRTAGHLAARLGHVRRTAFMPADDESESIARVDQGVKDGKIALAGDAEGEIGTLCQQAGDKDFAARTGGRDRCGQMRCLEFAKTDSTRRAAGALL